MPPPSWAHEPVELVDPDPSWREAAWRLITELHALLQPWLAGGVHHIGSTAVRGLPAKPIIDLMAGVAELRRAALADAALADAGWQLVPPELDGRPWRRFYVLPEAGRRRAHLHIVEPGHERWNAAILFRDRLRADRELRDDYARIKRRAAVVARHDREIYTRRKDEFVATVLRS